MDVLNKSQQLEEISAKLSEIIDAAINVKDEVEVIQEMAEELFNIGDEDFSGELYPEETEKT